MDRDLDPLLNPQGSGWIQSEPRLDPARTQDGSSLCPGWNHAGPRIDPSWTQDGSFLGPAWIQPGPSLHPAWAQPRSAAARSGSRRTLRTQMRKYVAQAQIGSQPGPRFHLNLGLGWISTWAQIGSPRLDTRLGQGWISMTQVDPFQPESSWEFQTRVQREAKNYGGPPWAALALLPSQPRQGHLAFKKTPSL